MKTIKELFEMAFKESVMLDQKIALQNKLFRKKMRAAAGGITGILEKAYNIKKWDLSKYRKYFIGELMNKSILSKLHGKIYVKNETEKNISWKYKNCPIEKYAIKNPIWWCGFCEIYHDEFLKRMFNNRAKHIWNKMHYLTNDSCCEFEIKLR